MGTVGLPPGALFGSTAVSGQFADPLHNIYINGSGTFSFNVTAPSSLTGQYITAIAIDSDGNTSEFSLPVTYNCDVVYRSSFESAVAEKCP